VRGDPDGYLELFTPDVTYFDPNQDRRVDGLETMRTLLGAIRGVKLPFTEPRYEMKDPKVQGFRDLALLTFQVVNYAKLDGAPETVLNRWNATQLYRRIDGEWKIAHSHWSYTKPDMRQ
jgi:ketosteroid isomerase-like protein